MCMSSFISGEVFLRKSYLLNVFQLKEKSEVSVTLCEHVFVRVCVSSLEEVRCLSEIK